MFVKRNHCITVATVIFCFSIDNSALAQEKPSATLRAAIEAHGGEAKIAKTLRGTLSAKATFALAGFEGTVSWQETFELPRRYHRTIKGQLMGQDFSMEYAITDSSGWIRQNGGDAKDYKGEKATVDRNWHA